MRVCFTSFHNYLDFSSGAAISMREVCLDAALLIEFLRVERPEICMTYGGYRFVRLAAIETRKRGIKSVFFLHNLSYGDASLFACFDAVVVPSEFARRYYKERLGIDCYVIPPLIDRSKVSVEGGERKCVTLVNPSVEKGVFFFLGLARAIGQSHPEVPFLIVEGRAKASSLADVPEVLRLKNLSVMRTVSDPRSFWDKTRILLVPSTGKETFCRLVVEAAFNSIPVIASDRGAIPETMGDVSSSGINACLPIPSRFTPSFRSFPTTLEVEPWRQSLLHVLQDESAAICLGRILNENAQRFESLLVSERIERFFASLLSGHTQDFSLLRRWRRLSHESH